MTLRITKIVDGNSTHLQVDGRLTTETLATLEAECEGGLVILDLRGITYVDSAGIDFLRVPQAQGELRLGDVSPYLKALLNDADSNS